MFKGEEKQVVTPWISSYPGEIMTAYAKIKSHSQFFLTDNNK